MTTDPEEGAAQAEAAKPKFKVGDIVRLSGGVQPMTITAFEDYGNLAMCEWNEAKAKDLFPIRSLVRIERAKAD